MFAQRQLELLPSLASDYLEGRVDLGSLVWNVGALLGVIDDDEFADSVFDDLFAFQAYAAKRIEGLNFPEHGKPFADAAARAIRDTARAYLDRLNRPDAGGSPPA